MGLKGISRDPCRPEAERDGTRVIQSACRLARPGAAQMPVAITSTKTGPVQRTKRQTRLYGTQLQAFLRPSAALTELACYTRH